MTLIVEDGSEVANANSYATDAEFVIYAAARGYTIPATEALRDVLQIKAMDYLASLEDLYLGYRSSSTQTLSFPRVGVSLYGYELSSVTIPASLKNAQMELSYQADSGDLLISETIGSSNGALKSFEVDGVYSEEYAESGSTMGTKVSTGRADAYLSDLLKDPSRVVRA
jgi:hypothetical protein